MSNAFFKIPEPVNDPVRSYEPGSPDRALLKETLARMQAQEIEVPLIIGGQEIRTGNTAEMRAPHDHDIRLGVYHKAGEKEVKLAIEAALDARSDWAAMPWEHRASIMLRAADLLTGRWRPILNAATMLGQSKTVYQAEIDSACELIDFWRFNAYYMAQIMAEQPISGAGTWNRVEYRPLEGFVFAVSPFNFTSIAANLPTAPALVGNVCIWKPASSTVYSNYYVYQLLREAGLPDGV
nr:aldehyde dehydrogenase family protein [Xanthomonadales bacterium]NIX11831.1 aldehyde dehydrogenase family protein [Xanthomonadales bacterium]